MDRVREIALKILYDIEKNESYVNIALDEGLNNKRKEIDIRDSNFISEIVYGTVSWKLTLDEIIKKYSNIKIKKISPWIINILRMSIYQIIFLDKVPKSAAVNEGVNLAKRYGHKSSSNFVNAILRKVEKKDYEDLFKIKNEKEKISKTTSMPMWIIEELEKEKTMKEIEEICRNSNIKPKLSIRVNTLKNNEEQLKKELEKEKIMVEKGILKDFLVLNGAKNIENNKQFVEGKFTIQDEGAGIIPKILNPKPEEKILDACSSPGGKTTYLAEIMQNKGEIVAWDIHEHRVKLVDEAARRLGITIIKTEKRDATIYEEKYFEYFDKILLDVPCLGIGVLKRKPDIKWKKSKEDIKEITKIQEKILQNCSKYLKKGGEIVYSTCSIIKEENEEIIQKFIKNNANFKLIELKNIENKYFEKYVKDNRFIQIYQNEKTDGFFVCKMLKS